ncbi:DUF500-domain-containing protein [Ramaria rubella]|nr:DUF500-domain-containing protein [Ramaria rubella]
MKINTPFPQSLLKECTKAAKIFQSFVDNRHKGLDGVIPSSVLQRAKGFAIFSVFKAGFVFSARAGSGIVIAKLPDGSWSAPSAIGTAGMGFGSQAGAEVTDFLIVLNSRSKSFMATGSLTLGGNMSIALGPLGRNGEASSAVNSSGGIAMMYSYSKTKGLFGGLSIEGSVIVERQDANAIAYQSDVSAKALLSGNFPPPPWAKELIKTLESCSRPLGGRTWIQDGGNEHEYAFGGVSSLGPESKRRKKANSMSSFPPTSWGSSKDGGSYFSSELGDVVDAKAPGLDGPPAAGGPHDLAPFDFPTHFEPETPYTTNVPDHKAAFPRNVSLEPLDADTYHSSSKSLSTLSPLHPSNPFLQFQPSYQENPFSSQLAIETRSREPLSLPSHAVACAVALHDFKAIEPGDLAFFKGDVIIITEKSDQTEDWYMSTFILSNGCFDTG